MEKHLPNYDSTILIQMFGISNVRDNITEHLQPQLNVHNANIMYDVCPSRGVTQALKILQGLNMTGARIEDPNTVLVLGLPVDPPYRLLDGHIILLVKITYGQSSPEYPILRTDYGVLGITLCACAHIVETVNV
jgi:hypothetical protein